MQTMSLNATAREIRGRKTDSIRAENLVPGIVYGTDMQPLMVTVGATDFQRTLKAAGESTLVDLIVDNGTAIKVLIQDMQRDPVRHTITHVDFRQVNMNKLIETMIELEFIGESAAVKGLGGTLVKALEEIEVKCLPGDLVHSIEVDLSALVTFDDNISVADLKIPEGIEVLTDLNVTVALIEAPRSEEELAALETPVEVDVENIEVAKKGKEEGEETATSAPEKKNE